MNGNDPICRRFYVTESDATRPGWRLSHQFAGAHPDVKDIDDGPRGGCQAAIADQSFASAVQNLYIRFVYREADRRRPHRRPATLTT